MLASCRSGPFDELAQLPRDAGGPVFAEPWQAQAFALAMTLCQQGHFTRNEWATALGGELEAAARRGEPDDGSRYYEHWLAALERLVAEKGLANHAALASRKSAWISAYQTTPHGQPVELAQPVATRWAWMALGVVSTVAAWWTLDAMGVLVSAGVGVLLGMRHAVEPDHLAAITTLMTGARSSTRAAMLGAWWGLGHTLTLLATGGLLVLLRAEMPALAARAFELGVVALLVGFGVRAIYLGAGRGLRATHSHGSQTFSGSADDRRMAARPLIVGAIHGLAGTGALVALVVATLPSAAAQLSYLVTFGVGSIVGMTVLSGLLGWPLARLGTHHVVTRMFALIAGGMSIALGGSLAASIARDGFL